MDYVELGYNFRMSNITAALGISQLKKIDKIIALRRNNAKYLSKKLEGIKKIEVPNVPKGYFHIYQMFTIYIKGGSKTRDRLKDYLNKKGIGAKVYFYPIHLTSFYSKAFNYKKGFLKETENISDNVLTLPLYPGLTKKEMDFMAEEIKSFFKNT
jgi:dTDP-4-amino-4,6-dideoxygalactose transaminase